MLNKQALLDVNVLTELVVPVALIPDGFTIDVTTGKFIYQSKQEKYAISHGTFARELDGTQCTPACIASAVRKILFDGYAVMDEEFRFLGGWPSKGSFYLGLTAITPCVFRATDLMRAHHQTHAYAFAKLCDLTVTDMQRLCDAKTSNAAKHLKASDADVLEQFRNRIVPVHHTPVLPANLSN